MAGAEVPADEALALQEKVLTQKTDFLLKGLAKKFFALCDEKDGEDAAAAAQAAFLKELHLFEFEVDKAKRIRNANRRELESYAKKQGAVEQKITQTTADISQLKQDLQEARIERKNKEEYDLIARKILELPSRQETTDNMTRLKSEIAALEAEDERLTAQTGHRAKQFRLLMHLIVDLEQTLKAEEPALEVAAAAAAGEGGLDDSAMEMEDGGASPEPLAKKRRT
jgi:predicted  nucleic acid-binding Zn-ribbon protein